MFVFVRSGRKSPRHFIIQLRDVTLKWYSKITIIIVSPSIILPVSQFAGASSNGVLIGCAGEEKYLHPLHIPPCCRCVSVLLHLLDNTFYLHRARRSSTVLYLKLPA